MKKRELAYFALGCIAAWIVACHAGSKPVAAPPSASDNSELDELFAKDQADRRPPTGSRIDWQAVTQRDRAREQSVKTAFATGGIRTGNDYYHAAMVLQHSQSPDDYLLAHEFSVVAAAKGNERALWLAAAAEDRFLMNIGRPQRFATQYRSNPGEARMRLYEVDPAVTDQLRREFGVPTLASAREREKQMNAPAN